MTIDEQLGEPESRELTAAQSRFWRDRGYIILKGVFSSEDVTQIRWWTRAESTAQQRARLQTFLASSLGAVLEELMGDTPILLRGVRTAQAIQPLHRDVWRTPPIGEATISGLIALTPIGGTFEAPFFYPASHRLSAPYGPGLGASEISTAMERVASGIREARVKAEGLSCAAGDVWLRHPALVHGGCSAQHAEPLWEALALSFCGLSVLPRDAVKAAVTGPSFTVTAEYRATI